MPISLDFEAIVAPFQAPLKLQLKSVSAAFAALGKWLDKQFPDVQAAERKTRDYPIIRFYNGAVTFWIDRSQWGALDPGTAPLSIGDRIGRGFSRFVGAFDRVAQAAEEDALLMRLVNRLDAIVATVEAAINRYIPPTPGLFDFQRRYAASDIFGALGLGVYVFNTSRGQLASIRRELGALVDTAQGLDWAGLFDPLRDAWQGISERFFPEREQAATSVPGAVAQAAAQQEEVTAPQSFQTLLETAIRGLVGAILIIPLIPAILSPIVEAAKLRFKMTVIDLFQRIEGHVWSLRQTVMDLFFVDFLLMGRKAYDLLVIASTLVIRHLDYFVRFGSIYVRLLFSNLTVYLRKTVEVLQKITRIAEFVRSLIERILNFDLMPIILAALGLPGWILHRLGVVPSFTVDDLITVVTAAGVTVAGRALQSFVQRAEDIVAPLTLLPGSAGRTMRDVHQRLRALRQIINISVRPVSNFPSMGVSMPPVSSRFPDLSATFGSLMRGVSRNFRLLSGQIRLSVVKILSSGAGLLDDLGTEFAGQARSASHPGSVSRFQAIIDASDRIGEVLYRPQMEELAARARRRADQPLVRGFEGWLTRGGFYVLEGAIEQYVLSMRAYWHRRVRERAEGRFADGAPMPGYELPTSPHILDRRFRMGRVRMPRMTIRAPGRALNEELTVLVAGRFKAQVELAYDTALEQVQ